MRNIYKDEAVKPIWKTTLSVLKYTWYIFITLRLLARMRDDANQKHSDMQDYFMLIGVTIFLLYVIIYLVYWLKADLFRTKKQIV